MKFLFVLLFFYVHIFFYSICLFARISLAHFIRTEQRWNRKKKSQKKDSFVCTYWSTIKFSQFILFILLFLVYFNIHFFFFEANKMHHLWTLTLSFHSFDREIETLTLFAKKIIIFLYLLFGSVLFWVGIYLQIHQYFSFFTLNLNTNFIHCRFSSSCIL